MNKKRMLRTFCSLFVLFFCFSCGTHSAKSWKEPNGKVKVLATIAMIGNLVEQIGGDYVDTFTLIGGELDPHSYQLVKGDDEKLAFANIIFFNGLGLEHGPSLQRYLYHEPKAIAIGDHIKECCSE